jgi:2-haloacid dehalogenase
MKPAAVVFDVFGTLLDIGSLQAAVARVCGDAAAFVTTWRDKQIQYAFASAIMDAYEDFDALTVYGLRYAAERFGVKLDSALERELAGAWEALQPYADVLPALDALRTAGIPVAALTNGMPATVARALGNAGIADRIDTTLCVESAGVYKPDRRVYELATAHFGVDAGRLMFVSSNGWDATGAAAFGMNVAWCNRAGAPAERFGPPPRWTIGGLDALAGLLTLKGPAAPSAQSTP